MRKNDLTGRMLAFILAGITAAAAFPLSAAAADGSDAEETDQAPSTDQTVTLRVSNWEEYIDLGDWDEEELIELDSAEIIGENSMIEDFEEWYKETYGINVSMILCAPRNT